MGPIVGISVYDALNQNAKNFDKVIELDKVAQCMDDYTYLNMD